MSAREERPAATVLTDGVRRSLEDARDTAERNIEYLAQQIEKATRQIDKLNYEIVGARNEMATNHAAKVQAEAMLNGDA